MSEWRDVLGYEGSYQVSSDGQVKSLGRMLTNGKHPPIWISRELLMATRTAIRDGYVSVGLCREGRQRTQKVHQLVAQAFHSETYFEGAIVCHRNGNQADNRASNLYWGTLSDNMRDAVRHGTHFQASKTHCPSGHEYTPENTSVYKLKGREGATYRRCRTCFNRRDAARRERMRQARRSAA